MNWRRPLLASAARILNPRMHRELELLRAIEFEPETVSRLHEQRLVNLLRHASATTDYYREVLGDCRVVRDGKVDLGRFEEIPFLTKAVIREQRDRLRARTMPDGRKAYRNSTGGSTGEPCQFWQDNHYWDTNVATKLYHFEVLGKRLGDRELKVWGSEHDLIKGSESLASRVKNWLYNRRLEQCFHLPEARIQAIIAQIKQFKPKLIWAYRDGIDVVARYVNRHGLEVHRPAAVVCGGGTIYPHIVENVQQAFRAPTINAYGSREMGQVACECPDKAGLHVSLNSHKVEVIDERGQSRIEQEGELVLTSLENYAMPFIRYRIGDRGTLSRRTCPCGRAFPLLGQVSGRIMEMLVNPRGETVDAMFLIHLFGVAYNTDFIDRFQVVQEEYDLLRINVILRNGTTVDSVRPHLDQAVNKIKLVMGPACRIEFQFVGDIPLTRSGKHPYVLSKLPLRQRQPSGPALASD